MEISECKREVSPKGYSQGRTYLEAVFHKNLCISVPDKCILCIRCGIEVMKEDCLILDLDFFGTLLNIESTGNIILAPSDYIKELLKHETIQ